MAAPDPLYIGADMDVEWLDARVRADDTELTDATVTFAFYTAAGVAVAGGSGSCAQVDDTNSYRGVLESTVTGTLTEGAKYYADLTLVQGAYNDARRLWYRAVYRGSN